MSQTTKRNPSLHVYLLTLIVVAAVLGLAITGYQQQLRTERARAQTADSMDFVAKLGASDIAEAVAGARDTAAELAANDGLVPLFDTPTPEGCSLSFTGAGPFTSGHLDIVNRAGQVLCSSREMPGGKPYAGAEWLDSAEPGTAGPVDDSGTESLVVLAPIRDLGVVAVFLDLNPVATDLEKRYGGTVPTNFDVLPGDEETRAAATPSDTIARSASVPGLGWTVRAGVREDEALDDASGVNRQMTWVLVLGLLLVAVLTELIYLGIARPIRRLSTSVRDATAGNGTVEPPTSGPAEVVSLGRDFATLTMSVKTSEEVYRTMFEANPQPTWVHDVETGKLSAVNAAMVERFGWARGELLSMGYDSVLGEKAAGLREVLSSGDLVERSGPWALTDRNGHQVDCIVTSAPLELAGTPARIVVAEDVTVQLHTERLLQRTERMESLGQLAGGIAHDFNNVLAVMLNYADFAAEELNVAAGLDPERWGPVLADVQQIGAAGDRAAALTRQLLAFARGDVLETGPVNINEVAVGVEHLLRRTLGEQVVLAFALDPELWQVEANVGQVEQVIVNLAVNARDAMPNGGRLSIETVNVEVDENYTASRPERAPGRYVRLRVSDTGNGMDARARDRAFEPFFTTKDPARGTGLGLATVYGVVKRAGGTIDIYSEPGLGTTVSMFLPVADGDAQLAAELPLGEARKGGTETVLLVEDDEAIRALAARILSQDGYQVLTAEDGPAAEVIAEERNGDVDLLLTDVVMPGMLGSELALRITEAHPHVRVLFMSGYAPPVLVDGGTLPFNATMVDKPFSADLLLGKVRQVLDTYSATETH